MKQNTNVQTEQNYRRPFEGVQTLTLILVKDIFQGLERRPDKQRSPGTLIVPMTFQIAKSKGPEGTLKN